MTRIPTGQENVVFSGARMSAPRAVQSGGSPLSNALRAWAADERERLNLRALDNVQQTATRVQQAGNAVRDATGVPMLAQAPSDTTGAFAEAFEAQARAVFSADLALDARRTASRFARENPTDPDAFAAQYDAYMQGQIKPLMEADAVAGEELRLKLDELGLSMQSQIIERAAGQAQENERVALVSTLQQFQAELQDDQLQAPDYVALQDGLAEYEARVLQAQESGLVSSTFAAEQVEGAKRSLTREYARGRFQQAVDAGDVGAARGVITTLRSGGLFDDNQDGRTLANSLAAELEASLSSANAVASEQLTVWNRTLGTAERLGTPVDNPEVRAAADGLLAFGNPAQQDAARRFLMGAAIREQFGTRINGMSVAQVDAELARLRENPQALSEEQAGGIMSQLEARREAVLNAQAAGNPLNAAPDLRLTTPPADRQRARMAQAQAQALPLDEVPHATDGMIAQAGEELTQARRIGDARRAVEVLDQLMATARDPHERMSVALQAGQPEVAAYVTMATLAPDTAETLFNLSFQGSTANDSARSRAFDKMRDSDRERIREAASLASMGRPAVRDELEVELQHAYVALSEEFESRGEGAGALRREFESLLTPFLQETELSTGVRLPAGGVSDVERDLLDEALTDRAEELFGEAIRGDDATLGAIIPVALPDGQWGFRDSRSSALIQRDGEIVKLDPRPALEQAAEAEPAESSFLSRLVVGRSPTQQALEVDIPRAASAVGEDERLLAAVFKAGLKMPSAEKVDREWTMLFSRENVRSLDRAAYQAAWARATAVPDSAFFPVTDAPDPVRDPAGAAVAAAVLMEQYAAKYGDADQALAAYYVGEDVIDAAGDEWRSLMPDDVHMFIERVKDNL